MAQSERTAGGESTGKLVEGIIDDAQKIIERQFVKLRREFSDEAQKAGEAGVALGAGAGLVAIGGLLASCAAAELLHRVTRLPAWSAYALVGGALGAVGVGFLALGAEQARQICLIPPDVSQAARENVVRAADALVGER